MCNACGFGCCASDEFDGCGCDDCSEPECWIICSSCGETGHTASECEPDDDYLEPEPDGPDEYDEAEAAGQLRLDLPSTARGIEEVGSV